MFVKGEYSVCPDFFPAHSAFLNLNFVYSGFLLGFNVHSEFRRENKFEVFSCSMVAQRRPNL